MIARRYFLKMSVISVLLTLPLMSCSQDRKDSEEPMMYAPVSDDVSVGTENVEPSDSGSVLEQSVDQAEIVPADLQDVVESSVSEGNLNSAETAGLYTIQVAVYKTQEEAERLVASLVTQGHQAMVSERTSKKGTVFYRVWVGSFQNADEAAPTLATLESQFADSFVRQK